MKIYFVSRRRLLMIGVFLLLVGGFMGVLCFSQQSSMVTVNVEKPIFQGDTGTKAVAITVNVDWGEEFIPTMLEEFKKANAQVTFFVTGKWAEKNPELLKQMASAGHSIQNHGYKHCHFNQLSADEVVREIKKGEEVIAQITGQTTAFFAPPYGEYNSQLVKTVKGINYKYIMWSVDTIDWQRPNPATIVKRVSNKVHNDAIILMHPTEPTVTALPDMLKYLQQQSYKMITINAITAGPNNAGN
ncbi:MAG: polysaccharide deacetylase family protein [Syntrophomonas sp.]|nr:polysaccharide deacetylase family protein [Syntrophomonas sp.]